jgi:E3 ubiquitin-protein ligase MUL1
VTQQQQCIICFENPRNTVFLECGHVACCKLCSMRLVDCPICRQRIVRVIEIYTP